MIENLTKILIENSEEKYKTFSKKIVPDTKYKILGVRVPKIRAIAKDLIKNQIDFSCFLSVKHVYYEEYFLHALLIANASDKIDCILSLVDEFLSYIDNWAICDSLVASLKIFDKYPQVVLSKVNKWLNSNKTYSIRFAIVILLTYFLDKNYFGDIFTLLNKVERDNYYVNMALAWFYSVAIVKRYDDAVKILQEKKLSKFVHNKTIQKCVDSFRIDNEVKKYLKSLRI